MIHRGSADKGLVPAIRRIRQPLPVAADSNPAQHPVEPPPNATGNAQDDEPARFGSHQNMTMSMKDMVMPMAIRQLAATAGVSMGSRVAVRLVAGVPPRI